MCDYSLSLGDRCSRKESAHTPHQHLSKPTCSSRWFHTHKLYIYLLVFMPVESKTWFLLNSSTNRMWIEVTWVLGNFFRHSNIKVLSWSRRTLPAPRNPCRIKQSKMTEWMFSPAPPISSLPVQKPRIVMMPKIFKLLFLAWGKFSRYKPHGSKIQRKSCNSHCFRVSFTDISLKKLSMLRMLSQKSLGAKLSVATAKLETVLSALQCTRIHNQSQDYRYFFLFRAQS